MLLENCEEIVYMDNDASDLQKFPMPANILKWIISFLTDRLQSTKVNSVCSSVTAIVQGSIVGPYGFIIYAHDFKVVGLLNSALNYADENTDVSAEDEIVFCAIILSIITYTLSAWGGYVTK